MNGVYDQTPPENYTYVCYDANGGEVSPKAQGYDADLTAKPMSTPTNGEKIFAGWYTAKTGGTLVTTLNHNHKEITLYARWQEADQPPQDGDDTQTGKMRPVVVTVNSADVNLRKGAGTGYDLLDGKPKAQKGEKLTIVETATGGTLTWGRFPEHGGGWICLDYTDFETAKKAQYATNAWVLVGKDWYYYLGEKMHTGWLQRGNTWYYMGTDGVMVTGTVTIQGKKHNFHTSGAWLGEVTQNGWVQEGGKWYYYIEGVKQTGWKQLGSVWYYFQADGRMHTGWLKYGKVWYYLQSSGAMQTGWLQYGGKWCYFDNSGAMVTGEKTIGPVTHLFDANGYWIRVK